MTTIARLYILSGLSVTSPVNEFLQIGNRTQVDPVIPTFTLEANSTTTVIVVGKTQSQLFSPNSGPMLGLSTPQAYPSAIISSSSGAFGWIQPLSEPVRRNPTVAIHNALHFDPFPLPTPFTTDLYSWLPPLSIPTRRSPRLLDGQQREFNYALTEPIATYGWQSPLSVPAVLKKPALSVTLQQSLVVGPLNPEVSFSWMIALAEPKRRVELPLAQRLPAYILQDNPIVSFGWFDKLNDPTRRTPRLIDGAQREFFFSLTAPVVNYQWFMPLDLPTRRIDARHIPDRYTIGKPPIVSFSWFEELSIPTRRVRTWGYLKELEPFQFGALISALPMDWLLQMSVPVRRKPKLDPSQQPSETTMYIKGNLPFARTGPLFISSRGLSNWRGRTRR